MHKKTGIIIGIFAAAAVVLYVLFSMGKKTTTTAKLPVAPGANSLQPGQQRIYVPTLPGPASPGSNPTDKNLGTTSPGTGRAPGTILYDNNGNPIATTNFMPFVGPQAPLGFYTTDDTPIGVVNPAQSGLGGVGYYTDPNAINIPENANPPGLPYDNPTVAYYTDPAYGGPPPF